MFEDRELQCKDCGNTFTFTAGEQEFYATKGLTNAPRRCPDCRRLAKSSRGDSGGRSYGGNSGGSYGSGRGGGYGSGSSYGGNSGYERAPRQMTEATCAQCGNVTQVPFVPRGDRPVYCSSCYAQMRGTSYSGSR